MAHPDQSSSRDQNRRTPIMTDTITTGSDPVNDEPQPSIGGLARDLCDLLWEADQRELPRPSSVSVYECTQHITLQFDPDPSSYAVIAQWAATFESTVTHHPIRRDDGPAMICRTDFTYYRAAVDAFAVIPHDEEGNADD
jgi:hypothetical protein